MTPSYMATKIIRDIQDEDYTGNTFFSKLTGKDLKQQCHLNTSIETIVNDVVRDRPDLFTRNKLVGAAAGMGRTE